MVGLQFQKRKSEKNAFKMHRPLCCKIGVMPLEINKYPHTFLPRLIRSSRGFLNFFESGRLHYLKKVEKLCRLLALQFVT